MVFGRRGTNRLDIPNNPQSDSRGVHFVASLVRYDATACQVARLPVRIRPGLPQAFGDFYFQAFDRLVTLPAAGYDYDIDWTPMSAGLARWNDS